MIGRRSLGLGCEAMEVYRFSTASFGHERGPAPRSWAPESRLLFAFASRRPHSCIACRCSSEGGFPVRIAPYPKRPLPTAQRLEIGDFLRCFLQNSTLCTLGVLLFGDASPADASDDIEPPLLDTVATEVYRFSRLSFGQGEGPTPRSSASEARLLFASARRRPRSRMACRCSSDGVP